MIELKLIISGEERDYDFNIKVKNDDPNTVVFEVLKAMYEVDKEEEEIKEDITLKEYLSDFAEYSLGKIEDTMGWIYKEAALDIIDTAQTELLAEKLS